MISGFAALFVGPIIQLQPWGLPVLLALVAVFFPWAAALINQVAAGTQYRGFGSAGLLNLGVPSIFTNLHRMLVLLVVVAAVLGDRLQWPAWWEAAYRTGYLAGPGLALFLFAAAFGYQTSIWLVRQGAVKRCSNDHEFSPFEWSCPRCSARRDLELDLGPARA